MICMQKRMQRRVQCGDCANNNPCLEKKTKMRSDGMVHFGKNMIMYQHHAESKENKGFEMGIIT